MKIDKHIVATIADDSYIKFAYSMIKSLLQNTHCDLLYILNLEGISSNNKQILEELLKIYGCEVKYKTFSELPEEFVDTNWKKSVWLSLMILEIMPKEIGRVLYLDSDMIILKDVAELFEIDLKGNCIAACPDYYVQRQHSAYIEKLDRHIISYINVGTVIIDLEQIRRKKISLENCLEVIRKSKNALVFADQDVWNVVFKNDIYLLDAYRYDFIMNAYEGKNIDLATIKKNLAIIHYAGGKPWRYSGIDEMGVYFWEVAKETPYLDQLLEEFLKEIIISKTNGKKQSSYKDLLMKWVHLSQSNKSLSEWFEQRGYDTIAIYGFADLGYALWEGLKNSSTKVLFAIDKNYENYATSADIRVFDPQWPFEEVDCVVITPYLEKDSIETLIKSKSHAVIVGIDSVIEDLWNV